MFAKPYRIKSQSQMKGRAIFCAKLLNRISWHPKSVLEFWCKHAVKFYNLLSAKILIRPRNFAGYLTDFTRNGPTKTYDLVKVGFFGQFNKTLPQNSKTRAWQYTQYSELKTQFSRQQLLPVLRSHKTRSPFFRVIVVSGCNRLKF